MLCSFLYCPMSRETRMRRESSSSSWSSSLSICEQYKKEHNIPVLQTQRYEELLARRAGQAGQMGMDREFMRTVLQAIHEESIRQQMEVLGK